MKSPLIAEETPFVLRTIAHQAWYEEEVLKLAYLCWPLPLDEVDRLFKAWLGTTVFPLWVALDFCLDRAQRGLSLPWEKPIRQDLHD